MEELVQGLMSKAGLSKEQAEKVFEFLQANASKVPGWLQSGAAKDLAKKVPGLGGLF
jgi:hypothetical protein